MKINLQSVKVEKAIEAARSAIRLRSSGPDDAVGLLRKFAEGIAKEIANYELIASPDGNLNGFISELNRRKIGSRDFGLALRILQTRGNDGVHISDAPRMTHHEISAAWHAFETILAELPKEVAHAVYAQPADATLQPPPPPEIVPPSPQIEKAEHAPSLTTIEKTNHKPAIVIGVVAAILASLIMSSIIPTPQPFPADKLGAAEQPLEVAPQFEVRTDTAATPQNEPSSMNEQSAASRSIMGTSSEISDEQSRAPSANGRDRFDPDEGNVSGREGWNSPEQQQRRNDREKQIAADDWSRAKRDHRQSVDGAETGRITDIALVRGRRGMDNFPLRLAGKQCPYQDRTAPCELTWRSYSGGEGPTEEQIRAINSYENMVSMAAQRLKLAARKFCGLDSCP